MDGARGSSHSHSHGSNGGSREEPPPASEDLKRSKRNRWDEGVVNESEERDDKRAKLDGASANDESKGSASALAGGGFTGDQNGTQRQNDASKKNTKTPNLSLDALAKAKKALQMQKELSEKLKKLPQLKASASLSSSSAVKEKETAAPSSSIHDPATTALPTSLPGFILGAPGSLAGAVSGVFPSLIPGLVPGGLPGAVPGVAQSPLLGSLPGAVPNVVSTLDPVLQAQQVAARLGLQSAAPVRPLPTPLQVAETQIKTSAQAKPAKAPILRLDAFGREIDEEGHVIEREKIGPVSTLKVNINKKKKESFQILHPELEPEPLDNPFYDPRMGINNTKLVRQRKMNFNFVEEGKFVKEAEVQRLKSQFGEAKIRDMKAKPKIEEEINPNLIEVAERVPVAKPKPKPPIPDVEWWDAAILVGGKYVESSPMPIKPGKITLYVEHPILLEPPAEVPAPTPQPLKLTDRERKKLRTQKRLAREKERQEMIRQGLLEPPKPKVKMSNLMKVLANEAVQDPTKMEKQVRKEVEEREKAHADRNLARKLTPGEKREKKERKLFEDRGINTSGGETFVSVYKIKDLSNPQIRFKVDINAQQNKLTGCLVMTESMNLVIVEGGNKSIKRYAKLMLKRINWNATLDADEDMDEDREDEGEDSKCIRVWNGCISMPNFEKFVIQRCGSAATARKFLADHHCGHFWDLAENYVTES